MRAFLALPFLLAASLALAGDASLNIYGLSYHWEREEAKRIGTDHEFNPGLGLRYALKPADLCATPFVEAAAYRDSGAATAVYVALGCRGFRLGDKLRLGGALAAFHSDTYNGGDPFIAPVPLLTWQVNDITLNFTHFPKVKGFNDINTTGFYFSLPLN